jgi:hypothetical protein
VLDVEDGLINSLERLLRRAQRVHNGGIWQLADSDELEGGRIVHFLAVGLHGTSLR